MNQPLSAAAKQPIETLIKGSQGSADFSTENSAIKCSLNWLASDKSQGILIQLSWTTEHTDLIYSAADPTEVLGSFVEKRLVERCAERLDQVKVVELLLTSNVAGAADSLEVAKLALDRAEELRAAFQKAMT